jgi:pimeloyl-ACP methyl ester carboxylesterase
MAQLTSDGWAITVTGYLTGNDSIFRNTSDALTDLGSLSGNGGSNPTVDAIQNWMIQTDVTSPILMGHSLGAMDVTVLYQRGFGSKLVLFSAPWVLPAGSLLPSSSEIVSGPRPVYVYSGTNDTISNMLPGFSGCGNYTDACRIGSGVNLIRVDTGGGFLSANNPHDRCLYQPFYFVGRPCQW